MGGNTELVLKAGIKTVLTIPTVLRLRTDYVVFLVGLKHNLVVDLPTGSQDTSWHPGTKP